MYMSVGIPEVRDFGSPRAEVTVVSLLIWMLGTELRSPQRVVSSTGAILKAMGGELCRAALNTV